MVNMAVYTKVHVSKCFTYIHVASCFMLLSLVYFHVNVTYNERCMAITSGVAIADTVEYPVAIKEIKDEDNESLEHEGVCAFVHKAASVRATVIRSVGFV